jgi:transcriptional regulator with XRE-family HTH domain
MSNIVTGRQLRAARILAGLTQKQLAQAVGIDERAARYWELKENKLPTSTPDNLEKIEAVLLDHGVVVFSTPTAGVRLASNCRSEGISRPELNAATA